MSVEVALTEKVWAGIDVGKEHHHCVVINSEGQRLLSRRVFNNEPELASLLDEVIELAAAKCCGRSTSTMERRHC
ncbi:hypothetical protein MPRG_30390 [Mycobacterium paragordonae]|uniref:Transposase IS110-like N-terminal domain-containing protein n=1 Tax=Mycobacterium paragordonae TaxID=1389713 RepID=A0ABQ1C5M7_9MYCO|nr:hypothetical protein MPRG_08160 [Mycobacterium paragordonae]GFG79763.1 hypothetical protein MPRG_30390 [Mycobacterium paragordonae]